MEEVKGSNPVESPEFFRFMRQLLKIVQQVRRSYLHLISNTALHITFLSEDLLLCVHDVAKNVNLEIIHVIWQTTSNNCTQVRAARLFFPIQPIRSLFLASSLLSSLLPIYAIAIATPCHRLK